MVTNYERGREVEWKAQHALERQGYDVVRSASSKSPVDLAVFQESHTVLVQLKRSKAVIKSLKAVVNSYGEDFTNLRAFRSTAQTIKQLWLYTDRKGWRIFQLAPVELFPPLGVVELPAAVVAEMTYLPPKPRQQKAAATPPVEVPA